VSSARGNALPNGAKGFDLGEAVLAFGKDKIVFSSKGSTEHMTMHLGPHSRVLDVHQTSIHPDGSKSHQTLYSISHANLGKLFQDLSSIAVPALMNLARPLDLDMLIANRIGVVVGLLTTEAEIETVTRVRHQKLVIDPEKLADRAWVPEFLDELYTIGDGEFFTLFSTRRRRAPRVVGHGFGSTGRRGRRELMWLSNRRLAAEMTRLEPIIREAAMRHAVRQDTQPPPV
jgi:hypothetical protein